MVFSMSTPFVFDHYTIIYRQESKITKIKNATAMRGILPDEVWISGKPFDSATKEMAESFNAVKEFIPAHRIHLCSTTAAD